MARTYSGGMRRRLDLASSMLTRPRVLFLDEPTIGLDVVSKQAVRSFLAELGETGDVTLVLTTHDLADIERLCRRLVVIDHGRVVHDGTIEDLHARYGSRRRLVADLETPLPPGFTSTPDGRSSGARRDTGSRWAGGRDGGRGGTRAGGALRRAHYRNGRSRWA